ncbi:MAG: hypothetical protein IJ249_04900 [Paludibacteraceae bacterium]|nr:hypothetical protein [Paludibacteraceae bacterium]
MRKNYCQPATEVAEVVTESQILAGSGGGPAPAPASGVNATRSGYGEGIDTW